MSDHHQHRREVRLSAIEGVLSYHSTTTLQGEDASQLQRRPRHRCFYQQLLRLNCFHFQSLRPLITASGSWVRCRVAREVRWLRASHLNTAHMSHVKE